MVETVAAAQREDMERDVGSQPAGARPAGHPRSIFGTVLLMLFTGGLFGLYWHPKVHVEVARQRAQTGRENVVWVAYGLVFGVLLVSTFIRIPGMREWWLGGILSGLGALLFLLFVGLQCRTLDVALHDVGAARRGRLVAVVVLLIVAWGLMWAAAEWPVTLQLAGILAPAVVAYGLLQDEYNRYWQVLRLDDVGRATS